VHKGQKSYAMDLVNQSEFARRANVSRQSIGKAVKSSKLRLAKDKKIDLHDALSVKYLEDTNANRQVAQEKKGIIPKRDNSVDFSDFDPDHDPDDDPKEDLLASLKLRDEKLKAQIQKLKVETAHKLGVLIERSSVEKAFDRQSAIILNYLFPLGDRLASKIAGFFENNDHEKINLIKSTIDKEIMRALDGFKDEAARSIVNWNKKK